MIFNKKKSFLHISILVLLLIGVYFVSSSGYVDRTPPVSTGFVTTNTTAITINASLASSGSDQTIGYTELANWTRGNGIELFNFTIQMSSIVTNISEINITMPSNGFSNITIYGGTSNTSNQFPNANGGNWTLVRVYNDVGDSTYIATFRALGNGTLTNGSYPPGGVATNNGNLTAGQNISLWFNVFAANGTEGVYNWTIRVRNVTTTDTGFGVQTGVDGLPPRANGTNVTDGINIINTFSGTKYLRYDAASSQNGVNISLTINDFNADKVLLIYNNTGGSLNLAAIRELLYEPLFLSGNNTALNNASRVSNFTVLVNNGSVDPAGFYTNLGSRSNINLGTAPGYVFSFNISNNTWGVGASDGTTFRYVFVVYDLYNHSEIINNSNADYVIARDISVPTATITEPSLTSIEVSNAIKYTCACSDTSGISSCTTKLTKPGGDTITKTGSGTEHTFTGTDTNLAGTYDVDCTAKDNVERTGTATKKTFTVSYSSGAGSSGAGGGSGGSGGTGSPGTTAENPLSIASGITSDLGSLSSSGAYTSIDQAGAINFNVAGGQHSVKVLTVTQNSVTIEVTSSPQQVTLNVGDTKEFDLNDDSKNDISITLSSITNGKADLLFKAITQVVVPPAETGGEVTGEPTKANLTWLWILIAVVVIALIWYFTKKK